FSFCVALYEALYDSRPFAGNTLEELSRELSLGRARTPSRTGPLWLRATVMRGLSRDPAQRHASMAALVGVLDRRPRGWRIAFAASTVLAVGALALGLARTSEPVAAPCRDAAAELAGVWNEPRRAAGQAAFGRTGRAFAATAWLAID